LVICSPAGHWMNNNAAYKAPQSDLGQHEPENIKKSGLWRRFCITFFWSLPIFVLISVRHEQFAATIVAMITAVIVSIVLSVGCGIVGMLIPSQRKIIFIPSGIILFFLATTLIGIYTGA